MKLFVNSLHHLQSWRSGLANLISWAAAHFLGSTCVSFTLVRFDPVYTCYFKTNEKRLADYPNLLAFVRRVYSIEPIQRSVNIKHIKMHYFTSHPHLNRFGIIPVHDGPDLTAPES